MVALAENDIICCWRGLCTGLTVTRLSTCRSTVPPMIFLMSCYFALSIGWAGTVRPKRHSHLNDPASHHHLPLHALARTT